MVDVIRQGNDNKTNTRCSIRSTKLKKPQSVRLISYFVTQTFQIKAAMASLANNKTIKAAQILFQYQRWSATSQIKSMTQKPAC